MPSDAALYRFISHPRPGLVHFRDPAGIGLLACGAPHRDASIESLRFDCCTTTPGLVTCEACRDATTSERPASE